MTLILMTTGVLAYLAARVGWTVAGAAHRVVVRRRNRAAAVRRWEQGGETR